MTLFFATIPGSDDCVSRLAFKGLPKTSSIPLRHNNRKRLTNRVGEVVSPLSQVTVYGRPVME